MNVVYTDGAGKKEAGVVTSLGDRGAFVRYLGDASSKLTRFEDIEPMDLS